MKRRALLLLGLLTLCAAWIGPLPAMARHSFVAHMTMHMAVVAVAAPLLALGIAGTRIDPVRKWPALFPPVPISVLELIAVWAWHAPALHHTARDSALGIVAEQGTFLACGMALWLAACGGDRDRTAAGVAALLLTSMHMTLLGALLALTPRVLYSHAGSASLADQHLGGAIMLTIGGAAYLVGGLWLTADLLRKAEAAA